MTDNTGSGFLKDIHLYPKNIVSKLSFELTKFGDDGTAQSKQTPLKGQNLSYTRENLEKEQN